MTNAIHPDADVGRVKLRVSRLERSVAFYKDVVGFEVLREEGRVAWLGTRGSDTPIVVLEEDASPPPRGRTAGLYHFAILVPDRPTLARVVRKLAKAGVPIGQADHLVSEALYFDDPDRNGIEMYRDRPRDEWPRDASGGIRMATDPIDFDSLLSEATEPLDALPPGTKIGHVHLHVSDLAEAKRYYCDVLGFDIVTYYGGSALFVSAGGYHHHLGLNTWAGVGVPPAPERGPGLAYYSVVLPNKEALDATLDALRRAGAPAERAADGGLREERESSDEAWFAKDPFGNRIRFSIAK